MKSQEPRSLLRQRLCLPVLSGVELLEYSSYKQDPLKFHRAKESLIAYICPKYGRNVIILEQDREFDFGPEPATSGAAFLAQFSVENDWFRQASSSREDEEILLRR